MHYHTQTMLCLFENIGNKLYYLRHLKREKIASVAIETGISKAVISKIENGKYYCLSVDLLVRLAEHYKTPLNKLLDAEMFSLNNHTESHSYP